MQEPQVEQLSDAVWRTSRYPGRLAVVPSVTESDQPGTIPPAWLVGLNTARTGLESWFLHDWRNRTLSAAWLMNPTLSEPGMSMKHVGHPEITLDLMR